MKTGAALAALLAVAGCTTGRAMPLQVSGTGAETAPCTAEVDGRRIEPAELRELARRWRGREIHIRIADATYYRCVGGIIYELQRAGVGSIGFISEPAPAQ